MAENRYAGHLNTIDLDSDKMEMLKDDYFEYDEYDEYYDYGYDGNSHFNGNASSPVITAQVPLRSPNSNPTNSRRPQRVSNRRNSYMHYNHHGTYLPLTPSRSETHYSSYEHTNRRPHRY